MAQYTIKQMELLSGIKAATIRMWEKRYTIFSPQRTDTNIRRYNDDDVRFIINISLLLKRGFRISRLACLSLEDLSDLASKFVNDYKFGNSNTEPLVSATLEYNESGILQPILESCAKHGNEYTFESLILPFLKRLGDLWQTGAISIAHEHFASNIIRSHINSIYKSSTKPDIGKSTPILFFLPEGEFHEIGLLYFAYVAKNAGYSTIYLGQSTPISDVVKAAKELKCKMLFTSFSSFVEITAEEVVEQIAGEIPNVEIIATGHALSELEQPLKVTFVTNSQDLIKVFGRVDPTIVQ
ncbi:MAG: MerR family transcriptional regulator [Bacteroidales bacterium]